MDLDELPSDPRKNVPEGFCEARLLGKICGEIFGRVKVGVLDRIFGGHHENNESELWGENSCQKLCATRRIKF